MDIDDRITKEISLMLAGSGVPGASVALVIDGDLWSAGIGSASLDGSSPLPADARFGVYSITKTVIAAIVMRLVERGAMDLDAPIGRYVPGLPAGADVPVRRVLNHSGGFPDYGNLADYHEMVRAHPASPWTPGEFLSRTLGDGMLFAPGTGWRYSNIGYMLLRLAIERVIEGAFRDAVRHETGLDVATSPAMMAELTPGFSGETAKNVIPRYHPGWVSHGLVIGTATELARFIDALFGGSVVRPESLAMMLDAIPVGEAHRWMEAPSYGLGLMIDPESRFGLVAGHTGGGPGYSTAAYRFSDVNRRRVTAVALVNRDGSDLATDIVFSMAGILAGHR